MTGDFCRIIRVGIQTWLLRCTRPYDFWQMYVGPVCWTLAYFSQIVGIYSRNMPGYRVSVWTSVFRCIRPQNDRNVTFEVLPICWLVQCQEGTTVFCFNSLCTLVHSTALWPTLLKRHGFVISNDLFVWIASSRSSNGHEKFYRL